MAGLSFSQFISSHVRFRGKGLSVIARAIVGVLTLTLPVVHQPGKRAVVAPLGGGGEKAGGELVRFPVIGDARTAATPPLARIGAGAFFRITATFHAHSSLCS